jgi:hypothetical protein
MAAEAFFIDFEIVCERQQHGGNDACWNERHGGLLIVRPANGQADV